MTDIKQCPCKSGLLYSECCGAVLSGQNIATTAELLMRSRYSAYVVGDIGYLLKTWHPSTKPPYIEASTIPSWCSLKIIQTEKGHGHDHEGIVEFIATALLHSKIKQLHEVSHFVKEAGQWLYVSGDIIEDLPPTGSKIDRVGRNCLCPCGSGKKFKKCCCH